MALPLKKYNPTRIHLRQYVSNPYKGSAFLASRAKIKDGLNMTFLKLLQNYRKEFLAVPYIYSDGTVLFHVKVPSETFKINKIAYDVLFLFSNEPSDIGKRHSLRNVTMYSNSPGFLYTYAYVYYHQHLIVDFMADQIPMIALTQAPMVRNPVESLGYEKSTYIAARYIIDGGILNDSYIARFGKKIDYTMEQKLKNMIPSSENLVKIHQYTRRMQAKKPRIPMSAVEKETLIKSRKTQYERHVQYRKDSRVGLIIPRSARSSTSVGKMKKILANPPKKRKISAKRTTRR